MEYCRVCLKESDTHESFTAEYREQFFQVTSIYIDEPEREFICPLCLKCLVRAHELRLDAIKADLWFREQLFSKQHETKVAEIVKIIKKCTKRTLGQKETREILIKNEFGLAPVVLFPQISPKNKFYICDVCYAQFSKKREIIRHMRDQHISSREFICSENNCGKKFKLLRNYRRHVGKHLPDSQGKWICEYCAKRFNWKDKLTLHLRSHTNIRPYKCTQCNASFNQKGSLNGHFKSLHSDDRPYLCKDCGLSFKIQDSLYKHRKRKHHHKGMLTCTECHKKVMCSAELKQHVAIYHHGERNHACKFCSKTYTKEFHLRRHYRANHSELYQKMVESGELRTVNRSVKVHTSNQNQKDRIRSNSNTSTGTNHMFN